MEKLSSIIKQIKQIIKENDLRIEDKDILEGSLKIYISNKIGEQKKENIKSINDSKDIKNIINPDKPTEKQIAFLKKNSVKINPNLTKEEAKIMISNYVRNMQSTQ